MPDSNFFRTQRDKIEKTQFQIAVDADCTPSAVAAWEAEKSCPKVENAASLASIYQVTEKRMIEEIIAQRKRMSAAGKRAKRVKAA